MMNDLDKAKIEALMSELLGIKEKIDNGITIISEILQTPVAVERISVDFILRMVCEDLNVTIEELRREFRHRNVVRARQIFSVIAIEHYGFNPKVVSKMLRRDRSTYYNLRIKHSNYMETDEVYSKIFNRILNKIKPYEKR